MIFDLRWFFEDSGNKAHELRHINMELQEVMQKLVVCVDDFRDQRGFMMPSSAVTAFEGRIMEILPVFKYLYELIEDHAHAIDRFTQRIGDLDE